MNIEMKKLQDGCPVMVIRIPKLIMKEIDVWVKECRKIKDHPLAELKAHENVGYLSADGKKHNSYQCSVPRHLVDQSFWLPWTLRLAAKHWAGGDNRSLRLRTWEGHFDAHDLWINFAYKNDDNPRHNHAGLLSGVIFYQNHNHPVLFDEYRCGYSGENGTMVLFPSQVLHHVEKQVMNKERITFAFNIIKT